METKSWNACISDFISLKNFYIHNKNDLLTIQDIATSLQLLEDKPLSLDCIHLGDLVAAKYENDSKWYRAKVLKKEGNACTVQYIDYGSSGISTNFKKLPEKIGNYHVMARHCMLDDVDYEEQVITVNNEMYDVVCEFMFSCETVVSFLNDKEPYLVQMKLKKWDNKNIKTFLTNIISFGITPKLYETLKETDKQYAKMEKLEVISIYVESINEFYVDLEVTKETKCKVESEIGNRTDWERVKVYTFGKMAVAKRVSDNAWCRVRILEIHHEECDTCTCYLVDFGTREKCTEFYEVVDFLELAPPILKRCSLYIPNVKTELMLDSLSKSFSNEIQMCNDKKIMMTIVETGEPWVVELHIDNLSVADVIKPFPVVITQVAHINALTVQLNTPGRRMVKNKLKKIKSLELVDDPVIGNVYAAKMDEVWVRVKLINSNKKELMDVELIDIAGEVVQVSALFTLPERIENIEALMMRCSLDLEEKEKYNVHKFRQICQNDVEFLMITRVHDSINGHQVTLFLDNKDVREMILNN